MSDLEVVVCVGLRWPWGFGLDPVVSQWSEWGGCWSGRVNLGLLTLCLSLIDNRRKVEAPRG